MENGIECIRGDNIRDININCTSYIFIKRLLQKTTFFFLFMHSRRLEIVKKKKFHTNCKFTCFLIAFFRSNRGGDRRNLYNVFQKFRIGSN